MCLIDRRFAKLFRTCYLSPGAFLKLDMPLFKQSTLLRYEVLGSPAQVLGTGLLALRTQID